MAKVTQPAEDKLLSLQPDGTIKGLGQALQQSGVIDSPVEEEVKESPSVEQELPEETPTPKQTRKIKWEGKEIEITPEEEIELLQKGFDYTKKTQALAEKERALAPFEGIFQHIQRDPQFAQYIYNYFAQQQQAQQPQQAQPPVDPLERIKWEIRQEMQQEFQKLHLQQIQPLVHQKVIDQVRMEVMSDPLYKEVQAKIIEYVKSLPPAVSRITYLMLDQDPEAYTQMYQHYRAIVAKEKEKSGTPSAPVRTTSAPLLEGPGGGQMPQSQEAARKMKIDKAKAKAMAGGDISALAEWLSAVGVGDMLRGKD